MAAASPAEMSALVAKLRGKGLDDAQVTEALRGMGYGKADAAAAVGTGAAPAAQRTGRPRASSAPGPAGPAGQDKQPPAPPAGGSSSWSMPAMPSFTPTLTPPRKLNGGDLAGFLGGIVLYTLALNYLRYGSAGVKGWFSAKFLNKPVQLDTPAVRTPARRIVPTGLTSTRSATPKEV